MRCGTLNIARTRLQACVEQESKGASLNYAACQSVSTYMAQARERTQCEAMAGADR